MGANTPGLDIAERTSDTVLSVEERHRRLVLDNEDLHHQAARLQADLDRANAEILALTARNTDLQQRLDRIERQMPPGALRVLRAAAALFGRR